MEAKNILETIKPDYQNLKIQEVDAESDEGQKLIQKYSILASPGILINDEFFSMGGVTKEQLRNKLDSFKGT